MIYDDYQCKMCGTARISNSDLCAGCLVREVQRLTTEAYLRNMEIKNLESKISMLDDMLKNTMEFGFKRNQENAKLEHDITTLRRELKKEDQDGESRVHENSGK